MSRCGFRTMTWLTVCLSFQLSADEPVVTLQSTVSGSQEQPRVMYIVPWQEPGAAHIDYDLDNRLVEEVFAPIDRDEFVRELNFRLQLNAGNAKQPGKTNF